VEELFGIHTFGTVHQMISTVACTLRPDASPLDILRATFPMGSMTGAPKLSAMRHIARLEAAGRGVYSGTIGFVDPDGDWDLNVVIRSLMHRADTGRVDATVGGAITLLSQAHSEHEECLLKAEALRQCLAP
jgi:para-aminobenzoate synthetase component 1